MSLQNHHQILEIYFGVLYQTQMWILERKWSLMISHGRAFRSVRKKEGSMNPKYFEMLKTDITPGWMTIQTH